MSPHPGPTPSPDPGFTWSPDLVTGWALTQAHIDPSPGPGLNPGFYNLTPPLLPLSSPLIPNPEPFVQIRLISFPPIMLIMVASLEFSSTFFLCLPKLPLPPWAGSADS